MLREQNLFTKMAKRSIFFITPLLEVTGHVPKGTVYPATQPLIEFTNNADSLFDTGNAITRIRGDIVGFELAPGDREPCILTFTYLLPAFDNDVQHP